MTARWYAMAFLIGFLILGAFLSVRAMAWVFGKVVGL